MTRTPDQRLAQLLREVRSCRLCEHHLPDGPRPVVQMDTRARILIAAQAPGRKVHATGIPFNDASGDRLREWLGLTREVFYDARRIAIVPMGFCYPGTGEAGDLPPRPECAAAWRRPLLQHLSALRLTLVIGRYALAWHLPRAGANVTRAVRDWRSYLPERLPLPHPSPRNNLWLARNPWFAAELLPELRLRVARALDCPQHADGEREASDRATTPPASRSPIRRSEQPPE